MITITNNNIYYTDISLSDMGSIDKAEIIHPTEIVKFLGDYVELSESLKSIPKPVSKPVSSSQIAEMKTNESDIDTAWPNQSPGSPSRASIFMR